MHTNQLSTRTFSQNLPFDTKFLREFLIQLRVGVFFYFAGSNFCDCKKTGFPCCKQFIIRDCAIIIRRRKGGGVNERGAQCKLTPLGRGGVTCKCLGKCAGGGGQLKLTLRFKYQRYFTKSCTHYSPDLFNMNKTWLTVYHIKKWNIQSFVK